MRYKSITKLNSIFFSLFLLLSTTCSFAEVINSQENSTAVATTATKNTLLGTAQDWHLTQDQWQRYQVLMQGPNGHWYPHLTPPAVLGLNAKTHEEQKYFAKIVAQQEHDKIAAELAFNHLLYVALRELYADEPIIRPFDYTPFNPIKSGAH
jgi:integrating conjugative element protein (TIGR03759 family)